MGLGYYHKKHTPHMHYANGGPIVPVVHLLYYSAVQNSCLQLESIIKVH